ncbi:MAG: xylulokinase, partial [Clostridia bacterium]|nr:xylulokinase [Clostridia bacterium]
TTIGTSGVVFAHTDMVTIDPLGRVHTFCCAVPGAWHVMGVTQAAGLSLKWFRDTLCADEVAVAKQMGCDSYDLINKQVAQSPIGANRLFYLPYLMGERTPHLDSDCRGAFVGLSAMHQKKDMARAVMEGVAYSLKDCQSLFGQMGLNINHMAACGGGAKSPIWRQMLSDLYGCDIMTVKGEGPALGVALLAGVGAGIYSSVPEACDAAIQYGDKCAPDADAAEYIKNYEFFRTIYPAMKDVYARLAHL